MSHHLDSPIARQDVRLDITDLYAFKGETGTAFVINVCRSIAGKILVPGYHPVGMYEIKVDLDSDAVEGVTYRFTFDERDPAGRQRFALRQIAGSDAVDPNAAGTVVARGVTGETVTTATGLSVWAGGAGDPFWIEPDVLHAVGHTFEDGTMVDLTGWDPGKAKNLFAATPCIPSCWRYPTANFSLTPSATNASASGPWQRSPPTPAAGVPSTALACQ